MSTNEHTSDEVPASAPPVSPVSPLSTADATAPPPASGPAVEGRASSAGPAPTKKKKAKKKKKANGASAAPPSSVAASSAPAASPASVKSVPPPSNAANSNGAYAKTARDDHESLAPVSDLDHHFFDSHSAHAHDSLHPAAHLEDTKAPDPRLSALMREETQRRRAQFTKYVIAAVVGSLAVCFAAVISVSMRRSQPDVTVAAAATTPMRPMRLAPPPPPVAETAATVEPAAPTDLAPSVDPTVEPAPSAPPSATAATVDTAPAPVPSPEAPLSATVAAADSAGEAPTELDPKAALKEKRQSQRALDNGKIADAITHGEASVKLDPTDAEAWLILGAAYQMKGDLPNAKKSFGSCLKEGKRGPRGECAAMPH
jgi:hypothetical protein